MDPEVVLARRLLGAALLQLGRTGEAIVELASAAALADGDPVLMAWLAHAQAVAGDPREARRLLVELRAIEAERYVSPYHVALVQTGLDDLDAAFDALDQAWLDRDGALGWVHVEPRFEPLRRDARYAALLERVGLG
jgi:Flp pilus assembly protein TadD